MQFFTAQRVCIARNMPWQDVCSSVRHTPVFCLNGYTYPQNFFTIGLHHHSSYSAPNKMATLRRGPLNGGVKCTGYEKITIFYQYAAFSLYLGNDVGRHI